MDILALLIIPLSFIAYVLKGVATFGPGIILVPLGALLIGAKEIVIVISFLDLISNASLVKFDKSLLNKSFLIPMIVAMIAGSCLGAAILTLLPARYFDLIFGLILLPLGLWIMMARRMGQKMLDHEIVCAKPKRSDMAISLASGCMSGLSGITGPVLAWHLNKSYSKNTFRDIMIPILLASSLARVAVYSATGSISTDIMVLVSMAVPGLFIGLWVGNKLFMRISQIWFGRIVGSLITLSGVKLLTR